jgi:glucose/arabinose dehydrogenase
MLTKTNLSLVAAAFMLLSSASSAQERPTVPLGDGPWYFDTQAPEGRIKVSLLVRGIDHPWGMEFLPSGQILVAERDGDLRIIRNGKLDPTPISGMPEVAEASSGGLMDLRLHPDFDSNRLLYFTYVKGAEPPAGTDYYATTVLARGRLNEDATEMLNVEDVFVADAWDTAPGGHGSRLLFAPDGTIFFSSPFRRNREQPQNTTSDISKLLRVNDDGSIPKDNPFIGEPGYLPEIYSIGNRAIEGLTFHPVTGELWASEHGPLGGDEVNIIRAGGNYGWPVASYGRNYDGTKLSPHLIRDDMIPPELFWVPSISPSGTMFYTGDRFRGWQGSLFVGSLRTGRLHKTGHVERINFNEEGEQEREWLLADLHQRIRDVRQGPEGLIYVLTEELDGALLVIEPTDE